MRTSTRRRRHGGPAFPSSVDEAVTRTHLVGLVVLPGQAGAVEDEEDLLVRTVVGGGSRPRRVELDPVDADGARAGGGAEVGAAAPEGRPRAPALRLRPSAQRSQADYRICIERLTAQRATTACARGRRAPRPGLGLAARARAARRAARGRRTHPAELFDPVQPLEHRARLVHVPTLAGTCHEWV